ncbi:MAG: ComF family protein [Arthrobacter sp.]|uniref:ComF family protein n=1 Tax=unclassified Arthrobacter TaxID=235627 RepID=UPI00264F076F|nr:ComF family protein [Micrococcaceae bacterium]MDN5824637.1 ComF family protein [Micrococcaceae bacterium]MDN5879397.1 ComF family protein [Micrococcaceae bacterium]MDN5885570.1 ComF family protein [Micrococcaceae bacterium]MDN5906495.1 ComF family protein [Micrococcaceae bacterium]
MARPGDHEGMEYPALPDRWGRRLDSVAFSSSVRGPLSALAELGSVAAPSDCVFCRRPDVVMCRSCRGSFRAATVRPFQAQDGAESLPLDPKGEPLAVVAGGVYAREVSAAVLAFKNRQRVSLAGVLGPALAGALRVAGEGFDDGVVLVPIPSTRIARARRGYAPVDVLLTWIQRRALLPPSTSLARMLRVRPGPPWAGAAQKTKGRRARSGSAAQLVLRRTRGIPDRPVLLVDDVLTTGATLARAHHQLQAAGVRVEGAVVLAATAAPRHGDGSAVGAPDPDGSDTPTGSRPGR